VRVDGYIPRGGAPLKAGKKLGFKKQFLGFIVLKVTKFFLGFNVQRPDTKL